MVKVVRVNVRKNTKPTAPAFRVTIPKNVRASNMPAKTVVKERDFFTDLFTRVVSQSKFLINKLLEAPFAAIVIVIAVVVTMGYQLDPADNFLITFANGLAEFKLLKPLSDEILRNPNRTMGALYHVGVLFAVNDNKKVIVILVGLVSLLMFKSAIENAIIALAVFAFITVRDKELRFIAILLAAVYGYYLVSTSPRSITSMRSGRNRTIISAENTFEDEHHGE